MKKMKQLDLFGNFRHVEDNVATVTAPIKPVKTNTVKTNTVKTKHGVGDLITYAGQYYEIGEICLPNYKLKGISNHMGNLYGGHYTSDCVSIVDNTSWYHFDDSTVSKYQNNNINTSNAYILMYEIEY